MKYEFRRSLSRLLFACLGTVSLLGSMPRADAAQLPALNRQLFQAQVYYQNWFGWVIGSVTVGWEHQCVECICEFIGPEPTITENLAAYDCEVSVDSTINISCPPTPECPGGRIGQRRSVTYECCISGTDQLPGGPYGCVSQTVIFDSCNAG